MYFRYGGRDPTFTQQYDATRLQALYHRGNERRHVDNLWRRVVSSLAGLNWASLTATKRACIKSNFPMYESRAPLVMSPVSNLPIRMSTRQVS